MRYKVGLHEPVVCCVTISAAHVIGNPLRILRLKKPDKVMLRETGLNEKRDMTSPVTQLASPERPMAADQGPADSLPKSALREIEKEVCQGNPEPTFAGRSLRRELIWPYRQSSSGVACPQDSDALGPPGTAVARLTAFSPAHS